QLCAENVAVANGRFTVQLDFGSQFAGQQRLLEVWVRQDTGLTCVSNTGFTTLSPRQSMTTAPNAAFSLNAASATNATSATNSTQLNGQAASFYQNAANLSTGTIPSARLGGSYTGVVSMTNAGNVLAGSGSGLTNLDATSISAGTLGAARLPVPMALSGDDGSFIFQAVNASSFTAASGVRGYSSAVTGQGYGVYGRTDSTTAFG